MLSAKRSLKVSENRILRRIFGPKREEVARGWRRLHDEEFYNLYASPNIIIVIKWRMGWKGMFVWKPVGKRELGRPKLRWKDNIRRTNLGTGWIWFRMETSGGLL
jgi:hypothetical protein